MTEADNQLYGEWEEDTQQDKYLTFSLGKELYGIEIRHVTEIIGIQTITEIPELPAYIRGIVNLRGKLIPVMDVRLRFGKPMREYNDRTCLIVIDIDHIAIGLIVDSVAEVLTIPATQIVPPPEVSKQEQFNNKYIQSIGKTEKDVILILHCDKLINEQVMEDLGELA